MKNFSEMTNREKYLDLVKNVGVVFAYRWAIDNGISPSQQMLWILSI